MKTRALQTHVVIWFLLACLPATSAFARQDTAEAEQAAQEAALQWLALLDAQEYDKSWDESAKMLKDAVSKTQWSSGVQGAFAQIGVTKAASSEPIPRGLVHSQYTEEVPNAPKGAYVILQYQTRFGGRSVIETVSMVHEGDTWKPAGYFIKPV